MSHKLKLIFHVPIHVPLLQVSLGSAAEGLLQVGDRVVRLEHNDSKNLTHLDAQNIFKNAGTAITLDISRQGPTT